jgi:predicted nucleic acid-binding protein
MTPHFIDTSAFLAVLDAADRHHKKAKAVWFDLVRDEVPILCHSYVLVETLALLQHRFGLEAVETFENDVAPILTVEWVDENLHRAGVSKVLSSGRKKLSLVDCVSFEVMRRLGIRTAFAFDKHFQGREFDVVP